MKLKYGRHKDSEHVKPTKAREL